MKLLNPINPNWWGSDQQVIYKTVELYLSGAFHFVFFAFKPQRIYHYGIQHSHHRYRDKPKKDEAGGTVCLGKPLFGPVFYAEISFLIKTDCEEKWTDKDG